MTGNDASGRTEEGVPSSTDRRTSGTGGGLAGGEGSEDVGPTRRPNPTLIALGMAAVGAVAAVASWFLPDQRTVLVVLASVGLFGGFLVYYLSAGRSVAASVAGSVYGPMALTGEALVEASDHSSARIYLPTAETVILYVPRDAEDGIPDGRELVVPRVAPGEGDGLVFRPTGAALFGAFEETLSRPLSDDPPSLGTQLREGLVDVLELAGDADLDLDADGGRLAVDVTDPVYPAGFDTPAASFLAVGLAVGLGLPVWAAVEPTGDGDYAVTCRWGRAPSVSGR